MPLFRRIHVALGFSLAACGGEPFPPPADAVLGQFGGTRTELVAGGRVVRVTSTCSFAIFAGPIVPDAAGNFVLPQRPTLGVNGAGVELEVRGRIVGDQIVATVVTTTPAGSQTEERTLTRGSPPDFSGFACLAAQQ